MKNCEKRLHSYAKGGQRQKSGGILCEGDRLEAYRFIDRYHKEFGIRWLLRRLAVCPNACYNYRKHRKTDYYAKKQLSIFLENFG
jgi:hypothetical protein